MSFLTVCLNPTLQKTLRFPSIISNTVSRTADHRLDASGKGINVTRVLTQLGKRAVHLTQLGGIMRPLFLSFCEQDGLSVDWVESESSIRFCYTLLTERDGGVTELIEESEKVAAGTEQRLLERFDFLLEDTSLDLKCLIISGTKAAGFSDDAIPLMTRKAKEKGLRVILDVKGKDLVESLQYSPDIIKPNLFEFASTFAPNLVNDHDVIINDADITDYVRSPMLDVVQKYGCRVILTDGSRKIRAAEEGSYFDVGIQPVKAVNSTGCGDAFTAGLASALEDGAGFREAIKEGIRCGAQNAALVKPGVILSYSL